MRRICSSRYRVRSVSRRHKRPWQGAGLIAISGTLLAACGGGTMAATATTPLSTTKDALTSSIGNKDWVAVSLVDNQGYVGHLRQVDGSFYMLQDAYYMIVQSGGNDLVSSIANQPAGPTCNMYIARDEIMLIEPLRSTSPMVQTIAKIEAKTHGVCP